MCSPVPTDVLGITLIVVVDHELLEHVLILGIVPFLEKVFFLVPKCRHRRGVHLHGKPRLTPLAGIVRDHNEQHIQTEQIKNSFTSSTSGTKKDGK